MKSLRILFYAMISCMLLLSSVFLFMPNAGKASIDGNRLPFLILGISFWVTLFASYILFFIINSKRKKNVKNKPGIKNMGFFRINSNFLALIFDVLTFFSLIPMLIMMFASASNIILYVFAFVFVFSLQMHAIFNGQNFKYIFSEIKKSEGK